MYSEIPLAVYMPHAVSLSLSLLRTLAAPDPVLGLQCWPIGCVSGGFVGDIQPVGAYGNCLTAGFSTLASSRDLGRGRSLKDSHRPLQPLNS